MNKFCSINITPKSDTKIRKDGDKKLRKIFKAAVTVMIFAAVSCTADAMEVIPSGECVGVKLYTDGLIVTDTTAVTGADGTKTDIAKGFDIRKGDVITSINGRHAVSNEMFLAELNASGNVTLTIDRDGKTREVEVTPAETESGPKLGLWLRDSTAGLGTVTCYYNDTFAALGHGIFDVDTGNIMPVGRGIIQGCFITSIVGGKTGTPGAIRGDINGEFLGTITANTENGLFGKITTAPKGTPVEVAAKTEVKCGEAKILADVDGAGVREYSINIKSVMPIGGEHDMVISVTDETLLEKTGGIVQGMSGAPIIQNNKLIGAVTHVFVKDPASGYAILAEHMLENI